MKDIVTKSAAAGYICEVELRSSTTGALVPSKVYTDITCKYVRQGCASVNITNRYAAAAENTAHGTAVQDDDSAWAWIESGIAGVYHFYAPNDCFKTGVNNVKIVLTCTGCIERIINISLIDANLRDAVHLGITGIPNAAAGAASGLAIVGSNMGTVSSVTGNVSGSVASVTAGVTLASSQHVIVDSGTVTTLTNLPAITAGWLTAAGIAASALNGKGDWNVGKTGYTVSTVSDKTGYSLAASQHVIVDSGTVTTLTNLPAITAGWLTATGIAASALNDKGNWFKTTDYAAPITASAIADAVWDELLSGHTGASSAGNALSTASSGGVDPSVLADAIWDEALSGHSTAGTAGKKLADANSTMPPTASAISTQVWTDKPTIGTSTLTTSDVDARLAAFVPATGFYANQPAASASVSESDKNAIAAKVVDQTTTGHTTAGTFGAAIVAAGTAANPWLEALPGSYVAGSAGYIIGTNMPAIKAKTDLITTGNFTVTSPLSADGTTLTINIGDDYDDAHGTQIDFTSADFPDLTVTGTVPSLIIKVDGVKVTLVGTVISATTARFEIPKESTLLWTRGRGTYSLRVKFADLDEKTLLAGSVITLEVL